MEPQTPKPAIVWSTMDNEHGEATLKQHAYISVERKRRITGDPYQGNKTLCSNLGASFDGETYTKISMIDSEELSPGACKKCLKIYNSL